MKYAHLLHAFYCEPWHLRSAAWRSYDAILQRALAGQEVSAVQALSRVRQLYGASPERPIVGPVDPESGEPLVPQMQVVGPIAIIPVQGVLGRHLSLLDLWCGGCDYENIAAFIEMAEGEDIQTVIFAMNTPGGMSAGCEECAGGIAELSASKTTLCFVDGEGCSAGFWLASQCGEIWATPTSVVGSVGTILAGEDNSAQWAQQGRKLELFTSSPLKGSGIDGKPWTDADRAYFQERMLQCDARIKNAVLAGRTGIDPAALDGRFFFADKAPNAPGQSGLDVGMVDAIASDLDEVLTAAMRAL